MATTRHCRARADDVDNDGAVRPLSGWPAGGPAMTEQEPPRVLPHLKNLSEYEFDAHIETKGKMTPLRKGPAQGPAIMVNFDCVFSVGVLTQHLRWPRRCPAEDRIALCGQPADHPIRLDRIIEPRFGPAVSRPGPNGARQHFPSVDIEQRQLAARLRKTALQIPPLRFGRPQAAGPSLTNSSLTGSAGPSPAQRTSKRSMCRFFLTRTVPKYPRCRNPRTSDN